MSESEYVMALITLGGLPDADFNGGEEWLMVEHSKRGWELPGGKLNVGEHPENAIIREVFEEAGLNVYVRSKPLEYQNGVVYWMGVKEGDLLKGDSNDPVIDSAKWFSKPPNNLAWGRKELEFIIEAFSSR